MLDMKYRNYFFGCLCVVAAVSCSSGTDRPAQPPVAEEQCYTFPDDFTDELVGKEVEIKNPLYVTSTYRLAPSGRVTVSSQVLRTPTDEVLPGSADYRALLAGNEADRLVLDPGKLSLAGEGNTLRMGAVVKGLKGTVSLSGGKYALTLSATPEVTGNERPAVPAVGACNMKVAAMNLNYYMASPQSWGHSNGAKDEAAFGRQQAKIVAAMKAMDADVYALCEIEEGGYSVNDLAQALNRACGKEGKYKGVDSGDKKVTAYTKNAFIYNAGTVTPYKDFKLYNGSYLTLRHVAQCFELKENGGRVVLAMNHFKAKSGSNASGADKDQGDGQSQFNARRVQEARDCVDTYEELKAYYGDPDVLVMGDLNSYSMEDPVRVFTDAGYVHELRKHAPHKWSYAYQGEAGYLDYMLSSPSLTGQVTGASPWDVNASEPAYFEYKYTDYYQADPYRYSDHNPVMAGLKLDK